MYIHVHSISCRFSAGLWYRIYHRMASGDIMSCIYVQQMALNAQRVLCPRRSRTSSANYAELPQVLPSSQSTYIRTYTHAALDESSSENCNTGVCLGNQRGQGGYMYITANAEREWTGGNAMAGDSIMNHIEKRYY